MQEEKELLQTLRNNPELAFNIAKQLVADDENLLTRLLNSQDYEPLSKLTDTLVDIATAEVIEEPVLANDGQIYEEETLDQLIKDNKVSPLTRDPLVKLGKVRTFIAIRDALCSFHEKTKAAKHKINPLYILLRQCIPNSKRNTEVLKALLEQSENCANMSDEQLESLLSLCILAANIDVFVMLFTQFKDRKALLLKYFNKTWKYNGRPYPGLIYLLVENGLNGKINELMEQMDKPEFVSIVSAPITHAAFLNGVVIFPNLLQLSLFVCNYEMIRMLLMNSQDMAAKLLQQKVIFEENAEKAECNIFDFVFGFSSYFNINEFGIFLLTCPKLLEFCSKNSYSRLFKSAISNLNLPLMALLEKRIDFPEQKQIILDEGFSISALENKSLPDGENILQKICSIVGQEEFTKLLLSKLDKEYVILLNGIANFCPQFLACVLKLLPHDNVLEAVYDNQDYNSLLYSIVLGENNAVGLQIIREYLLPEELTKAWQQNPLAFIFLFYVSDAKTITEIINLIGREVAISLVEKKIERENYRPISALEQAITSEDYEKVKLALSLCSNVRFDIELLRDIFRHGTPDIFSLVVEKIGESNCNEIKIDRDIIEEDLNGSRHRKKFKQLLDKYFPVKLWLLDKIKILINSEECTDLENLILNYKNQIKFEDSDFEQIINETFESSFRCSIYLSSIFPKFKQLYIAKCKQRCQINLPILYQLGMHPSFYDFLNTFQQHIYDLVNVKFSINNVDYENILEVFFLMPQLFAICSFLEPQQRVELLKPCFQKRAKGVIFNAMEEVQFPLLIAYYPHLIKDMFDDLFPFLQYFLMSENYNPTLLDKEVVSKIVLTSFRPSNQPKIFKNLIHKLCANSNVQTTELILKRFEKQDIKIALLQVWDDGVIGLMQVLKDNHELSVPLLDYFDKNELSRLLNTPIDGGNVIQFVTDKFPLPRLSDFINRVDKTMLKAAATHTTTNNQNVLSITILTKDMQRLAFVISKVFQGDLTIVMGSSIIELLLKQGTFDMFKLVIQHTKFSLINACLFNINNEAELKANPDYPKMLEYITSTFSAPDFMHKDLAELKSPKIQEELLSLTQLLSENSFLSSSESGKLIGKHPLELTDETNTKRQCFGV